MTGTFLQEEPSGFSHGGPHWPELPQIEQDVLDRLLLFARADNPAGRSDVLRDERTGAARAALTAECADGRWSTQLLRVHQLGLLAWLLATDTGDRAELATAADWLGVVHGCDPALLPEPLRSARREQFSADGLAGLIADGGGRERASARAAEFIGGGLGWAATPREAEAVAAYGRARDLSARDAWGAADDAARQALAALSPGHWLRPFALNRASLAHASVAQTQGVLGSEEAERLARQAIDAVSPHHPFLPWFLVSLHALRMAALTFRWWNSDPGAFAMLPVAECREVVDLGRRALALLPEDHPRLALTLSIHTTALFLLLSCDPTDRALRAEMVRTGRLAAQRAATPLKEADRWLDLGDYLKVVWAVDPQVIQELIEVCGNACRVAPTGSVTEAQAVYLLGWAEFRQAAARGDVPGLNAAAEQFLRVTTSLGLPAADDTPDDAANRAVTLATAHSDLQDLLATRAGLTGDRASRQAAQTVRAVPPEVLTGSGDLYDVVNRRAAAHIRLQQTQHRFAAQCAHAVESGSAEMMREAAEQLRYMADQFAAAVPEDRRPAEDALRSVEIARAHADILENGGAVESAEDMAAGLLAGGTVDMLLDDTLFGRADGAVSGEVSDAVSGRKTDVELAALRYVKGHEVVRFRLTVARQEAERAFAERQRGESYTAAWSRALAFCERAYADPAASPVDLLPHARFIATVATELGDLAATAPLLASAVRVAGALASPRLPREERQELLRRYLDRLADLACAAALLAGEPAERALAVLEAARGLLSAARLHSMTELGTLRRVSPDAAARFETASAALAAAQEIPRVDCLKGVTERHRATDRWEAELDRIRDLPGFEDFLKPLDARRIRDLADRGPLIHLTLHSVRSHALLVTADGVAALSLPGVSPALGQEWSKRLNPADETPEESFPDEVRAVLAELWDVVTEPVLRALGLTGPPESQADRPRVWWVPSGWAAFLPLHAAGRFSGAPGTVARQVSGDSVLDRVVSSYTPTLRALRHARLRDVPAGRPSVLAVAVPEAAGPGRLDWAVGEAKGVVKAVGGRHLPQKDATRAGILRALPEHPWLHYAGHAADGALQLGEEQLTPQDTDRLSLPSAELVYLSGCGTARGTADLADESLHLTAALHLAGHRDAVGTLWPVRDRTAAEIAEHFYGHLLTGAGHAPAAALDAAVRAARDRHPGRPDLWAAYLHIGP